MYLKTSLKLPKGIFNACVTPRPIFWISSVDAAGRHNLAPFSFANIVSVNPPMVMFTVSNTHREGGPKDTLRNIRETKEFTVNMVTFDDAEKMNISSCDFPVGVDEFIEADVSFEAGLQVKSRRVLTSPISMECTFDQEVQLPLPSDDDTVMNCLVLGKVVGIHINDEVLTPDGRIDIKKSPLIARLGYENYAKITDVFQMSRPKWTSIFQATKILDDSSKSPEMAPNV